jgi:hypothetical protein
MNQEFLTDEEMEALEKAEKPVSAYPDFISDDELHEQEKANALRGVRTPPLSDQLVPEAIVPAVTQAARSVPVAGALADRAREALTSEDEQKAFDDRQREAMRRFPTVMKGATLGGAVGGSFALPSPASKMTNLGGAAARVGEAAAVNASDAAIRGENPGEAGLVAGGTALVPEMFRIKNWNRVFGGIPEEMQDYYMANRQLVNRQKPVPDVAADMNKAGKKMREGISKGSGESFDILKKGQPYNIDHVLDAIDEARGKIRQTGAFGAGDEALIKQLDDLGYKIMRESPDLKNVPPEKVKYFINAFRNITGAYERGNLGGPHPPGEGHVKGILKDADKRIDGALKDDNPEYKKKMIEVSRATRAMKPVARALSDETKSLQYVRRLMRGKDPAGMQALKDFDAAGGTTFHKDIPAAYTKEFLTKGNTNGSRQVNTMKSLGKAIGGSIPMLGEAGARLGEGAGALMGAGQDVYARKIGKALMDISSLPGLGSSFRMLHQAATKSPYAAIAMYRFLKERDAAFAEKMQTLLDDDETEAQAAP